VLSAFGLTPADLRWEVTVANLKPFQYTQSDSDRVVAVVTVNGDDNGRHALQGRSPTTPGGTPLVPPGQSVPLGSVQLTRDGAEVPGLRLRFTPAVGHVYGPTDLAQRSDEFVLPAERLILDPAASWCGFGLTGDDPRTNPNGLFAGAAQNSSAGLVDDVCDGFIRVSLTGVGAAVARIVVGPPDFAPDRRPVVSAADGLADRVAREAVHDAAYAADRDLTSREVRDLFERALETMENINVDAQNDRVTGFENLRIAAQLGRLPEDADGRAFPTRPPLPGRPLPLSDGGRALHRRFVALEVIEDILREQPQLLETYVREPRTEEPYYDRRMPALMRGSDRAPMHLTRRQYDLLRVWMAALRADIEAGT
jgi:hypothetical protein